MQLQEPIRPPATFSIAWALVVSLALHGATLFLQRPQPLLPPLPPLTEAASKRIEATLTSRPSVARPSASVAPLPPVAAAPRPAAPERPPARPKLLATENATETIAQAPPPAWSAGEKAEMNKFFRELEEQPKPGPDLAQRSLAMARVVGRHQARQDDEELALVERRPNTPPVDPLSLEMYLDSLVKKLNRSAAFVRNDPRSKGMKTATVMVRVNPDGSLQSFKVINAADQQDEIVFIQSVVERAVPFATFPADIQKSVQSLAMLICILPRGSGEGGFGFARTAAGKGC